MARRPTDREDDNGENSDLRIRMYRVSVGDCFLLSFGPPQAPVFRMLIDCGIHQSSRGGADRIREVAADIVRETGGRLDLLVVTHEHADHISGFRLARNVFLPDPPGEAFAVSETWFAWTENDADEDARALIRRRRHAIGLLAHAHARLRPSLHDEAAGETGEADGEGGTQAGPEDLLGSLLGFVEPDIAPPDDRRGFMDGGAGSHSRGAFETIRAISGAMRYREPGEQPFEIPGADARIYVLGPPREERLIRKSSPSRQHSEVYHFGGFDRALAYLEPALGARPDRPFSEAARLPLEACRSLDFFQRHYFAPRAAGPLAGEDEATSQDWRRIDQDWLDTATALALKLDHDTNNTSLVLAIELGKPDEDGPVILFPADAQVGNWLSWQDVVFEDVGGRRVTGPDLLRRTAIYKAGHHGSHNATLKDKGLELMEALALALVPTDQAMAEKVRWGDFPLPELMRRLEEKTGGAVVRTDREAPTATSGLAVRSDPLFYEIAVTAQRISNTS